MDTRFWGPSGWKLLHLITFDYNYSKENSENFVRFFESLPYILPCKFCRASLTDYYRELPFQLGNTIIPGLDLRKWLYNIHNCVNNKLRKQGLNPTPNPKYSDIKKFYEDWAKCDWSQHLSTFWDFLFAVAYNHPRQIINNSTPMPNCPSEVYKCKDKCEKNKWNVLGVTDRIYWFNQFWLYLPVVLPVQIGLKWREAERKNPPTLDCRKSALAWLWRMRCTLDSKFQDPYTVVCKKLATFSSDCGKRRLTITCRKRRLNKTLKNKK